MPHSLPRSAPWSTSGPTYGYRRITALLKRKRRSDGHDQVNAKRVYRLMKKHGLLLARHTGRRQRRKHESRVIAPRSNMRWCSDGLEFTCWNGEIVRVVFAVDCHDREVIGWVATTAGISGAMIRDLMVECVEVRCSTRAPGRRMAHRQRLRLRRCQHRRHLDRPQPQGPFHPGRKPGKQRHRRGVRQNLQARLRPDQPTTGCPTRRGWFIISSLLTSQLGLRHL